MRKTTAKRPPGKAPSAFTKRQAATWRFVIEVCPWLTYGDRELITAYCRAAAIRDEVDELPVGDASKTQQVARRAAASEARAYMPMLGLTPESRAARLAELEAEAEASAEVKKPDERADAFDALALVR